MWSRYSFVGVRAAATLTEQHGQAIWLGHAPVGLPTGGDPLVAVRETLRLLHTPRGEGLPPFTSGLVGYISYDAVRRLERLPDSCVDDLGVPELAFLLASDLAVLDHHSGEVWLVANAINFDNTDERVDEAYADAVARVESMTELLIQPTPAGVVLAGFDEKTLPIRRQRTPEEYQRAVSSAVEEIKAGEAFPDRRQPAVRGRHQCRRARYLPRAAPDEPESVHVPAQARRLRHRRLLPRGIGHRQGSDSGHPSDRRLETARRHSGGGRRLGG